MVCQNSRTEVALYLKESVMKDASQDNLSKLGELIDGIDVAMLTTVDQTGKINARPMQSQELDENGSIWFMTSRKADSTDEIQDNSTVNVSYVCHKNHRYVSVSGRAFLVKDNAKLESIWKPAYKAWFPEGVNDPNIILIRVDVDTAAYWDSPSGAIVHLVGFVKAVATGKPYRPGDHDVINIAM
jgi:general stress protein 26